MAGVGGRCHSSLGTYSDRPCDMIGVIHPGLAMSEWGPDFQRTFFSKNFFFLKYALKKLVC